MDRWLGPLLGWDREGDLDKAPKILLGICGVQLLMLLLGLVIGFNNERCYIYVPEGGQIRIDCNDCNARTGPLIRDWFVMLLGVAAIGVGVHGGATGAGGA